MIDTYYGFWEYWELYHKVTFDGPNKRIIINPGETSLNIKQDIYSAWKEWIQYEDNSKFLQALRSTGGDPLTGTTFLDGYFFLLNNWKLVPPDDISLDDIELEGNIFDEAGGNIFDVSNTNTRLVRLVLSSKATFIAQPITASVSVEVTASIPSSTQVTASLAPNQFVTASLMSNQTIATASYISSPVTLEPGQIVTASLSSTQETMLLEMYRLLGLDPTRPLIVSSGSRFAGSEISQSIVVSGSSYVAQRI